MEDLFSVKNHVVIITGAGRGIGQNLARSFAQRKAIVYAFDKTFENNYPTENDQIKLITCELTDVEKFKKSCNLIYNQHKRIDVLINNAGVSFPSVKNFYSIKKWKQTIDVNLTVAFTCSQTVIKKMIIRKKRFYCKHHKY